MASAPASYIGLARKYRPQNFADLVGQEQIGRALAQQFSGDRDSLRISQAYIFSGPRGIGKTSSARILAKCLNCLEGPTATPCGKCEQCHSIATGNSMDVIEIDGASNNGVEDIRNLQETISQNPFSAWKKVYIIDEVHMLSKGAFNALLKTLEEPPPFVVFIFATTEPERIPETIKSRCQVFQFRRISMEDLIRRLDFVTKAEEIKMDPGERHAILEAIAFAVDGGLRDAMMALDQVRALGDGTVRLDETVRFLGVVEHELLLRTMEWIHHGQTKELLEMVNELVERGRDLERFVKNFLSFLRDLMVLKSGGGEELVKLPPEKRERARELLWTPGESGGEEEAITYPELLNYVQVFMDLEARMKEAVQVRILLEFAFVKLTAIEPMVDIVNLLSQMESGKPLPARPAAPQAPGAQAAPAPRTALKPPAPKPQVGTPDLFNASKGEARVETSQAASDMAQDANALWQGVLSREAELGMALHVSLMECTCKGQDGNLLILEAPAGSMAENCLCDPRQLEKVEKVLAEVSGQAMKVRLVKSGASRKSRPAYAKKPEPAQSLVSEPAPAQFQEPQAPPPATEEMETVDGLTPGQQIYFSHNPEAKARYDLDRYPGIREKVEMVQRFFQGRVLDASGNEIHL